MTDRPAPQEAARTALEEAEMDAPEEARQFLGMRETWWLDGARWALARWRAADPDAARAVVALLGGEGRLPEHLRGDGPCRDCGTLDNIVWFTDNVFWNRVTGESVVAEESRGAILCIPCFVTRADRAGLDPTGWRLIPDWPWREVAR